MQDIINFHAWVFRCCCFSLGRGVKMPVTHALSDAQKRSVQSTNATKSYHGSQCQNPMSIPWTLGWNHDRCRLALEGQRLTSDKMAICFFFVLLLLVYTYFHLQQLYQIKSKSINNQPIKTFSFDSYYFYSLDQISCKWKQLPLGKKGWLYKHSERERPYFSRHAYL